MKKLAVVAFALILLVGFTQAQEIPEKSISDMGYGEKKMKKAPRKIYISRFNIYFHVIASATASSKGGRQMGGGSYRGDTKTTMTVAIDGVDVENFQRITDQMYELYVADLKSQGFELITTEEASGIKFYEDWTIKDGGEVNYANVPGYVSVTPTGTKYMVKKETKKGREKKTFVDRTGDISGELDDAIVSEVVFAFPFVKLDANSSNMLGTSSVKGKTDFALGNAFGQDGMTALYENSKIKYAYGDGPGLSIVSIIHKGLKKEVDLPGVFKEEKFKERTNASTGATPNYYGIVFTSDRVDNVTHRASCDPEKYEAAAMGVMTNFMNLTHAEFFEVFK